MTTNPLTSANQRAFFWRFMFFATTPALLLAVVMLTGYVHQHQGEIRRSVVVEINR